MVGMVTAFGTLFVSALLAGTGWAGESEDLGVNNAESAYENVCWYESLKAFPPPDPSFDKCSGQARSLKKQLDGQAAFQHPKMAPKKPFYFGKFMSESLMGFLPSKYGPCDNFLKDDKAAPEADESDVLKDKGKEYPLKGFAHCMMSTLRKFGGDKAIEALKTEVVNSKKEWRQTILDRENDGRELHGVEPLQLLEELNQSAQKWAEVNAKDCKMYHSKSADRILKKDVPKVGPGHYNGKCGENLMTRSNNLGDDKEHSAYIAANGWYEEIKDYNYKKPGVAPPGKMIGHFTQSVWKGSRYVGYGLAENTNCPQTQIYLAAQYYPAGNYQNEYPENVLPLKKARK